MMTEDETNVLTLSSVLRHTIDGVFVLDRERRCVLFSSACEKITGYERSSVVGAQCRCYDITDCKDEFGRSLSEILCPGLHVLEGYVPQARQRMQIRHRDGRQIDVETIYSPIRNDRGEITHVIGIVRDLTDLTEEERSLRDVTRKLNAEAIVDVSKSKSISTRELDTDLVKAPTAGGPLDRILAAIEKREILAALHRSNSQRTLAARSLGISRSRLYRRMEALGIDPRNIGPHEEH